MPIDFSNAANIRNVNTGNLGGDPRQVLRLSNRACPPAVPSSLICPPTSDTPCLT